jgi:hypothetical protein
MADLGVGKEPWPLHPERTSDSRAPNGPFSAMNHLAVRNQSSAAWVAVQASPRQRALIGTQMNAFTRPGVCVVCFGQYSASMGSTVTRSFTAWASCRSSVISASAWS